MSKIFLSLFLIFIFSFSIFTDSNGDYRRYRLNDLPLDYRVNSSTPANWITAIQNGASTWNKIDACYFEFNYAGLTEINEFAADGTNLVYFDFNYDNFDSVSNVIAFSGTFTEDEGSSNFRAVESDLVWNAASFPPAVNDSAVNPSAQDLQGIITHEFGHHLGLGHTGNDGSPPGVGELIREATMYGFGFAGDTTARSLHIDDIIGAISIYPRWTVDISLFDSLMPLDNFKIYLTDNTSAYYDETVSVASTYQKAGYVENDSILVSDSNGLYSLICSTDTFGIKIRKFGYQDFDTTIAFNQTINTPVIMDLNVQLKEGFKNNITLNFINEQSDTINSVFRFFAYSNEVNSYYYQDTSKNHSSTSFKLPSGTYDLQIEPDFPYAYKVINNININRDTTFTILLDDASVLIIDDDYDGNESDSKRETFYINYIFDKLKINIAYLNMQIGLSKLIYNNISHFKDIVWLTGNNQNPSFVQSVLFLDSLASNNHNIILSGNHIASAISGNSDLKSFFSIDSAGFSDIQILQGIEGDIIGQGEYHGISVAKPERMSIIGPNVIPVLNYLGSEFYGAVRYESNFKIVLFSFALEDSAVNNNASKYLNRTLEWFDTPVSIYNEKRTVPGRYELFQNYPNPFNPKTIINYKLPITNYVNLSIYNLLGQKVATLVNKKQAAGSYTVEWDATGFASGVYLMRIKTNYGFTKTRKLVLLK